MKTIPEWLWSILLCPDCRGEFDRHTDGNIICRSCGREYKEHSAGFPDLRPTRKIPMPKIFDDVNFQRWQEYQARSKKWFYEQNRIAIWVHNAGHRAVRSLSRGNYRRVLDLGCGDGAHYPYHEHPESSVGIDIDDLSLASLRVKYPTYPAIRADATALPFCSSSFDCVLSVYNMEHILLLEHALDEIERVLVPDGDFIVSVPAEGGWLWDMGRRSLSEPAHSHLGFDYQRAILIDHVNCIWQIDRALRRRFRIVRRLRFPLPIPWFHLNAIVTYRCRKS
ncbi:MAG: class I SAM-dependent methyltransferase [Candidatus Riflebacteria bacterium]|nr:class I SAM-dependent methyltransferase [Candidatus Riflebacteria bacterium]